MLARLDRRLSRRGIAAAHQAARRGPGPSAAAGPDSGRAEQTHVGRRLAEVRDAVTPVRTAAGALLVRWLDGLDRPAPVAGAELVGVAARDAVFSLVLQRAVARTSGRMIRWGHMTSSRSDRTVAYSVQLSRAHRDLRRRISRLQERLQATPDGTPGHSDDPEALAAHCLAFCSALTTHHVGEDAGMFTALLEKRPDLADLIGKLVQDHEMIGTILQRVADLAERARSADVADRRRLGGELDGLAAIMESHFRFEERAIGRALDDGVVDGIIDDGWSKAVFTVQ